MNPHLSSVGPFWIAICERERDIGAVLTFLIHTLRRSRPFLARFGLAFGPKTLQGASQNLGQNIARIAMNRGAKVIEFLLQFWADFSRQSNELGLILWSYFDHKK